MKCPACLSPYTKVIDSRDYKGGEMVRRRRLCMVCHHRFTTFEYVRKPRIRVIKKNGVSESFKPEKIRKGLVLACEKLDISATAIDDAMDLIERRICTQYPNEVTTAQIGDIVMNELKKLNYVAYVRFAAVYREFKDIDAFLAELELLRESIRKEADEKENALAISKAKEREENRRSGEGNERFLDFADLDWYDEDG